MQPWFKVVKPYQFIESLGKREDLLVADLGDVLTGVAHLMYRDPELFVKTTHFTSGLIQFLESIQRKITTGEGNSIIRVQTRFGGGKTHSLIAIHHFLTNRRFFSQNISVSTLSCNPKTVRIIGTHLNPLEGRQETDSHIYTLWGELAYQVRGNEGYKIVQDNDQKRISPGKASLFTLLQSCEPIVILLDEITEYMAKARGVRVNDSNLGLQTLIFLQELTECMRSLKKSILIITLPDREYQATHSDDKPLLIEIDQILGRLASSAIPSERTDLYQIIQKKLIEDVLDRDSLNQIVETFSQFYYDNKKDFPVNTATNSYRSLMEKAYPFHPALIDILIEKWNKQSTFQGTRTILSILAKLLYELRIDQRNISIINQSDINFTKTSQNLLFFRHLPSEFTEILIHELDMFVKPTQTLMTLDKWEELGRDIIAAIFLNSIPHSIKNYGALHQEINLAIWRPEVNIVLVSEVLGSLIHTSEFLHKKGNRFILSEAPNMNKIIKELKHKFVDDALHEIKEKFRAQKTDYPIKIVVWPESSEEIPDDTKLKLVVLSLDFHKINLDSWIKFRGEKFRKFQNTILFGIPNAINLERLIDIIQEKIAIKRILMDRKDELEFNEDRQTLNSRLLIIENSVVYLLNRLYLEFTDTSHQYHLISPKQSKGSFANWIIQELIKNEVIVTDINPNYIKEHFLTSEKSIETRSLLDQFLKDLKMPKLLEMQILQRSILEGFEEGLFLFEDTSDQYQKSNFSHQGKNPDTLSFTENECLILPSWKQEHKIDTDIRIVDKSSKKTPKGLSFRFKNLSLIDLQSVNKGILKPLERELEGLQLGITIQIKNPEKMSNKMTLSLIKETVNQIGGEITELDSIK
ncbi:hypothetical protein CEE45_07040 [Candidatus Heimdallarchaeota archaeon B3_Heim]|nr:MAG: hypothetical protein CEE45_07040 [Candidatus Heimdallarchaeota archaeon B3_Heim]